MRVAEVPSSSVVKRLNRKLEGHTIRRPRGILADKLGHILVSDDGRIVRTNVNLERLAREKDVLEPFEVVASPFNFNFGRQM